MTEGKADGPEDIAQPRADVLAARQALELAQQEWSTSSISKQSKESPF
jgi:hypothetical protein